jgi:thiol-disulfide isomerase/thioredoxin
MPEYEGKVNAPDFPEGMEWLNTGREISLRELRGKVVLLDFWTYCCINCMHVIPALKKLEHKYPNELVVIGVHSAKFTNERDTDNIRQAILRYEIEHPVVNDKDMAVWQAYTVRGWPSLYLIDPAGKIIGYTSGEGIYEPFDKLIAKVIETFDAKKLIDRRPLSLKLERNRVPASMLAFPGKVLADEKSKQLFIADSNHNRIVVLSLEDNSVKEVIGTGEIGLTDGSFESAAFNHPQGMAFDGVTLFVADTENHSLRAVDFGKRTVMTIAGTGQQSREHLTFGGQSKQIALNSPWDLALHNGMLYIAMAGPHQLWRMNPKTGGIAPYAGTGPKRESTGRSPKPRLRNLQGSPPTARSSTSRTARSARYVRPISIRAATSTLSSAKTFSSSATRTERANKFACSIRSASPITTAGCTSPTLTTTRSNACRRRSRLLRRSRERAREGLPTASALCSTSPPV